MARDTDPLLSSNQVTNNYDATNNGAPRGSSSENIEGQSSNTRDDTPEENGSVPAGNLHLIMSSLFVGVFLSNADTSIVIATAHKIASEFGLLPQSPWLVTSYTVAMCSMLGVYGKLSDIFGRKPVLSATYCLFVVGCLLCGLAPHFWTLLAGRAFSGLGAADLVPVRSVATWRNHANIIGTLGRIIGAPLGGYIFDVLGWRWSFLLQAPIASIALALTLLMLPESSITHPDSRNADTPAPKSKLARIDFAGGFALVLTICALSLFLDTIGRGEPISSLLSWLSLLITGLAALSFVCIEQYVATEPLLPISLLSNKDVLLPCLMIALQHAAHFGTNFSIPMYFEITRGATASEAGSYLLATMFGFILGSFTGSIYISKTGKYKGLTVLGCTLGCFGFSMLMLRFRGEAKPYEIIYLIPVGMAMGIAFSTMFTHVIASTTKQETAIANSCFYLFANMGLLLGLNFSTALLHFRFFAISGKLLEGIEDKRKIIQRAFESISYVRDLPPALQALVIKAYVQSFGALYGLSLCLAVLGLIIVLLIRERRL